ncbi:MFS transporter [Streptomyces sp. NPDC006658]|uniref:MFS transporter n=1 Tax=Streptomyces sp. NPDC006658 TaxID=3156900 RepID=UPI0033DADAB4
MTQILDESNNSPALWRNRRFMAAWVGQTVSDLGTQVTTLAIPLVAVLTLHASTFQVGVLRALSMLAFLVVALPAGPLVDRWSRRSVMLWCDLLRALVMVGLPVAVVLDLLAMWQLYVAALLIGFASVVFGVAFDSYRVGIVPKSRLAEANARFAVTESVSRFSGPSIGATLVSWMGAVAALAVDALSYLVSFAFLAKWADDTSEQREDRAQTRRPISLRVLVREVGAGISFVRSHHVLSRITAYVAVGNLSLYASIAVMLVFMVESLHMNPAVVGFVFAVGEVGGFLAGLLAARVMRRVGSARTLCLAAVCAPVGYIPMLASPENAVWVLALFMFASSARYVAFDIAQYTYRQSMCPPQLLGRMNASIRWVVGSAGAAGSLTGGWLGVLLSPRLTLAIAATVLTLGALLLLLSPLRQARDFQDLDEHPDAGRTSKSLA